MARNLADNERMRTERRARIIRSALKLFAAKGLAATKISEIAADAEMSQGLLYHYFQSKEEIFVELIRGAFERMNAAALGLEGLPISPREKIAQAIAGMLDLTRANEDFGRYFLLISQATGSDAVPDEAKELCRDLGPIPRLVIGRIMEAGQRDGSIRQHDPEELALVFWALIKGLAIHRASVGAEFKPPDPGLLAGFFFTATGTQAPGAQAPSAPASGAQDQQAREGRAV